MSDLAVYEEIGSPLPVETIKHQIQVIQEVMAGAMVKDTHYGVIPGCGDKPTLLKAGAEKLSLTFRLSPTYVVTKTELGAGHREYEVRCTLTHIPSGRVFGEGVGVCSTHETKFRYRKAERTCPSCGNAAIIKGKAEYGGGWLCYARKGGCGAKFSDNDPAIIDQQSGRVDNPDIADTFNTVLKMAKKRAHVDAVLTATAASDIFAQDLEDLPQSTKNSSESISEEEAANYSPVQYPKSGPHSPRAPQVTVSEDIKNTVHDATLRALEAKDQAKMAEIWKPYDADTQVVLFNMFNSMQRSAIKKLMRGDQNGEQK